MRYAVSVAFEVGLPLSTSDPDVRSISRLPGFVRLEQLAPHGSRYELSLEIEAGSVRDAMDATDSLVVEYTDALNAYHPRLLEAATPKLR